MKEFSEDEYQYIHKLLDEYIVQDGCTASEACLWAENDMKIYSICSRIDRMIAMHPFASLEFSWMDGIRAHWTVHGKDKEPVTTDVMLRKNQQKVLMCDTEGDWNSELHRLADDMAMMDDWLGWDQHPMHFLWHVFDTYRPAMDLFFRENPDTITVIVKHCLEKGIPPRKPPQNC